MEWSDVGNWLKDNAGTGASLIGSLITGNIPGAVATGISLVSSATGSNDPDKIVSLLQSDPQKMIRLKELAYQNESEIRNHIESMERLRLEDIQNEHQETQKTIRSGDVATDEYVRRTRPGMARQSWGATVAYCLGSWVFYGFTGTDIFDVYLAGVLSAPAWAYLGLRTGDKFAQAISKK